MKAGLAGFFYAYMKTKSCNFLNLIPLKPTTKILLLLLAFFFANFWCQAQTPIVKKGVIDLRGYNLHNERPVKLQGDWEFDWLKILTPEDYSNRKSHRHYFEFPKMWNGETVAGETLTGTGYATYRLQVLLGENRDKLSLKIPTVGTAGKIFIDGEHAIDIGIVGKTEETSVPMMNPFIYDLNPIGDTLELVIQISNFDYKKGGPWKNFILGREETLREQHEKSVFFDFFLLGAFAIIGLHFIGLYVLRKKEDFNLWYGLGAIAAGLRVSASGEYIISYLEFPGYELIIGSEIFSFFAGIGVFALYLHSIFPHEFNKKVLIVITVVSFASSLLVLFTPAIVYSETVNMYQVFTLLFILYACWVVAKAVYLKRNGAGLFAIGFFIFVAFIINDIILNFHQNYDIHLTGFGFFIFMAVQSYLVSYRFTSTFNDNERLTFELNRANQYLEKRVEERTKELNESLEELKAVQANVQRANIELEKANDSKDKLFSIIGHDLKGPLNSIKVAMEYLLEDFDDMDRQEIKRDVSVLSNAGESAIDLLNNLFEWAKTQTKAIEINPENVLLGDIADSTISLLNENARQKSIHIENRISEKVHVFADRNMIETVIRNLLSNAVKFTPKHGIVELSAKLNNEVAEVTVKDNGVGINEESCKTIFEIKKNKSTLGTNDEKGTGLGLIICKEFVELNGGTIGVKSELDKGTAFTFTIPLSKSV